MCAPCPQRAELDKCHAVFRWRFTRSEIEVGGGSTKDLGLTHLLTKEWLGDLLQQVMVR